ncbi:hypothetical protein BIV57_16005, partial [Mangrovactinospora gilvigrisea]
PLLVDVAVPLVGYFLLKHLGLSTVAALTVSGIPPLASALWSAVRQRRFNGLAALMVVTNVVGISTSLLTGNARFMFAKDGVLSSVFGIAVIVSAFAGRSPLMTAGLKPMTVKGKAGLLAAWDRLAAGTAGASPAFRAAERGFSLVWGLALLFECVARVVCAFVLPVHVMAWLHSFFIIGAIVLAVLAANPFADRIEKLVKAESAMAVAPAEQSA